MEHSPQEREIARRWLRTRFQIGVRENASVLDTIVDDTSAALSSILSPKQKRKFEQSIPHHIAELRAELQTAAPKAVEQPLNEEQRTARLDETIRRIEAGFASLEAQLRNSNEPVPPHFFRPFDILRENASNQHRNHHRNLAQADRAIPMQLYQFSMAQVPRSTFEDPLGDACFNPQYNIVTIPDDFNPDNIVDLFSFYHELQHVRQFHEMLERVGPQTYFSFVSNAQNFLPHFEVEAWALNLEGLDRYVRHQLRNDATLPVNPTQLDAYARLLRVPPEKFGLLESLLKGTKMFFPHGLAHGTVSPSFASPLVASYARGKRCWKFEKSAGTILPLAAGDMCNDIR